jgi:hypothetical protein
VTVALDAARIAELESLFPDGDLAEFVDGVVQDLATEIENAAAAVANEDLTGVVDAAHSARNHALICGATELGLALEVLQAAAGRGRTGWAVTALAQVSATWPATREAIARLGQRSES